VGEKKPTKTAGKKKKPVYWASKNRERVKVINIPLIQQQTLYD
jgi:hypothetical protein